MLGRFAHSLGWVGEEAWFVASDGDHEARVLSHDRISVHMRSIAKVHPHGAGVVLDSGSPHYVTWVTDLDDMDLVERARRIRYDPEFRQDGINVNFIQESEQGLRIRTYERGVEDETLSCGTGVTAAAIAWAREFADEGQGTLAMTTKGES